MTSTPETLWARRDCVSAEVDGSLVLLDLDTLVYHSLNTTASAIWQALESPSTVSRVALELQSRFAVEPEHCRQAVTRLLTELEANRLVSAVAPTPAQSA